MAQSLRACCDGLRRVCSAGCRCAASAASGPLQLLDPLPLGLAKEIARPLERSLLRDTLDDARPGLEGVVINDVLMAADWKVNRVNRVVPWRGTSHINTLELEKYWKQFWNSPSLQIRIS